MSKFCSRYAAAGFFAIALIGLSGCASVSVSGEAWKKNPVPAPSKIYVKAYTVGAAVVRADRSGAELDAFREKLGGEFSDRLVDRLSKSVVAAERWPGVDATLVPGAWVMEGEVLRLNQGSRALRAVIGWGLGGTKMETVTRIYEVEPKGKKSLLGELVTSGGSNAEPGAIFSGPFGAAPRLVLSASLTGVSADARRTSRMIVAAVSEKLSAQGTPLVGEPMRAKRPSADPVTR